MFWIESNLKWHAWEKERGTDKEVAMKLFIEYAEPILDRL